MGKGDGKGNRGGGRDDSSIASTKRAPSVGAQSNAGKRSRKGNDQGRLDAPSSSGARASGSRGDRAKVGAGAARPTAPGDLQCEIIVCGEKFVAGGNWGQWREITSANGSIRVEPFGFRCAPCEIVRKSEEMTGDWEQIKVRVNGNVGEGKKWMRARYYASEGSVKPWWDKSVNSNKGYGDRIKLKLRGFTAAQFERIPRFRGKTWTELGYKHSLIPDYRGQMYNGLLLIDDGTLGKEGLRYEKYLDIQTLLEEQIMQPNQMVREKQAEEVVAQLQKSRKAGGLESNISRTLRLNALDPAEVGQRVQGIIPDNVDEETGFPLSQEDASVHRVCFHS